MVTVFIYLYLARSEQFSGKTFLAVNPCLVIIWSDSPQSFSKLTYFFFHIQSKQSSPKMDRLYKISAKNRTLKFDPEGSLTLWHLFLSQSYVNGSKRFSDLSSVFLQWNTCRSDLHFGILYNTTGFVDRIVTLWPKNIPPIANKMLRHVEVHL